MVNQRTLLQHFQPIDWSRFSSLVSWAVLYVTTVDYYPERLMRGYLAIQTTSILANYYTTRYLVFCKKHNRYLYASRGL